VSRKARESAATQSLSNQVDRKATGRLTVGAGPAQVSVYLLKGDIVAATSPTDERHILRLAELAEALPPNRSAALDGMAESGESIFGAMVDEIEPSLVERLLNQRFLANLAEFVGSMARPAFEPMGAIFVDNLQFGTDTPTLLAEASELWERAETLSLDVTLIPGAVPPADDFSWQVIQRLEAEPCSVGQLISEFPWEPLFARAWLIDLFEQSIVAVPPVFAEPEEDWAEDDATEHSESRTGGYLPAQTPDPAEPAPSPSDLQSDGVARPAEETIDLPPPEGTENIDANEEDVLDFPTAPSPVLEKTPVGGDLGKGKTLKDWLVSAHSVDDSELGFFEDHDYSGRGGTGEDGGTFSSGRSNLDKVEVNSIEQEAQKSAAEQDTLEVDEVPAARYSAPTIDQEEAFGKIAVTNDVLGKIVVTFDEVEGPGRGRAVVQLLVDGSPSRYVSLFSDIQVTDGGELPAGEIVSNLLARPATEQRLLINQALSDMIDRALSTAADELPEEALDQLLEGTAGFRARLGL
jgi:hypothetical protein